MLFTNGTYFVFLIAVFFAYWAVNRTRWRLALLVVEEPGRGELRGNIQLTLQGQLERQPTHRQQPQLERRPLVLLRDPRGAQRRRELRVAVANPPGDPEPDRVANS